MHLSISTDLCCIGSLSQDEGKKAKSIVKLKVEMLEKIKQLRLAQQVRPLMFVEG